MSRSVILIHLFIVNLRWRTRLVPTNPRIYITNLMLADKARLLTTRVVPPTMTGTTARPTIKVTTRPATRTATRASGQNRPSRRNSKFTSKPKPELAAFNEIDHTSELIGSEWRNETLSLSRIYYTFSSLHWKQSKENARLYFCETSDPVPKWVLYGLLLMLAWHAIFVFLFDFQLIVNCFSISLHRLQKGNIYLNPWILLKPFSD